MVADRVFTVSLLRFNQALKPLESHDILTAIQEKFGYVGWIEVQQTK